MILALPAIGLAYTRTLNATKDSVSQAVELALEFNSETGYGGLIHNFKNAVLRPDETSYLNAAEDNAVRALELLDQLEILTTGTVAARQLQPTRDMIIAYARRLEGLRALNSSDLSTAEVDEIVRYDDSAALNNLQDFQNEFVTRVQNEMAMNIRAMLIWLLVVELIGTTIILGVGYILYDERKKRNARKMLKQQEMLEREKRASDELRKINESLNRFSAIAAHDLKSPSRQIKAFSEMAMSEDTTDLERKEYLDAIHKSASNMQDIVSSLLEFSQRGFSAPEPTTIELSQYLNELTESIARQSGRNLRFDIHPTYASIEADPALLERVFANLIDNSKKYVPESTDLTIEIAHREEADRHIIMLRDNGPGVPDGLEDYVFEPLRRGHAAKEGQGIGLALVRSILRAHGGNISLRNDLKPGAAFEFWIPKIAA
jgi:signal transduction histidine kinase